MGRHRTGSVSWDEERNAWVCVLTIGPRGSTKRSPPLVLKQFARDDEKGATAYAVRVAKRAHDGGAVSANVVDTCGDYFDRWVKARKVNGIRTTKDDEGRWKKWLAPHLDTKPIVDVTKRDLEIVVSSLDRDVRAKKLSWKTAVHVWSVVSKMFDDAADAKDVDMRVREGNPAKDVRGPDHGNDRSSAFLFPNELATLLAAPCVPVERKRMYVLAVYLGVRAGELRALTWDDVNLEAGYVHVHRSHDRVRKEMKSTKTGTTRRVPIEAALRPLLEAMHEAADGKGNVLSMPTWDLPAVLRADLHEAQCTRGELFANDETRRPLDFHDLRHTYGSWCAIRGDDVIKIRFAMGHTDITTTQRYINEAHVFGSDNFGAPFSPLPSGIFDGLRYRSNYVIREPKSATSCGPSGTQSRTCSSPID